MFESHFLMGNYCMENIWKDVCQDYFQKEHDTIVSCVSNWDMVSTIIWGSLFFMISSISLILVDFQRDFLLNNDTNVCNTCEDTHCGYVSEALWDVSLGHV